MVNQRRGSFALVARDDALPTPLVIWSRCVATRGYYPYQCKCVYPLENCDRASATSVSAVVALIVCHGLATALSDPRNVS